MEMKTTSLPLPGLPEDHGLGGWFSPHRLRQFGAWAMLHRLMTGSALAIIALFAIAAIWWLGTSSPIQYATAQVTRGDVVTTITASGTVNPVTTVEVGTYVSGPILSLSCDYNTKVQKGQLCAKIDPRPYQIVVDQDAGRSGRRQGPARQGPGQSRLHRGHAEAQRRPASRERNFPASRRCRARRQQSGARARQSRCRRGRPKGGGR